MTREKITFNGLPAMISGKKLRVGDKAPFFQLVGNVLEPITLNRLEGKIGIISCVPSLDTPVCSLETRRFN